MSDNYFDWAEIRYHDAKTAGTGSHRAAVDPPPAQVLPQPADEHDGVPGTGGEQKNGGFRQ